MRWSSAACCLVLCTLLEILLHHLNQRLDPGACRLGYPTAGSGYWISQGLLQPITAFAASFAEYKALVLRIGEHAFKWLFAGSSWPDWLWYHWQCPPLQVLQMERDMLDILGFELTVPTAKIFLRRYVKATATENGTDYHRCAMLAAYLAELTLPDYESLQFLPSQVGAMHNSLARQ